MKKKTIRVPLESWLYLQDICRYQRGGTHLSEKSIAHFTKEMQRDINKNGHELMDGSLGGAIGKPENSYEEHRWTSWSLEEMKKMLDEKGLPYEEGEEVDVIDVYF